MRIIAGAHKGRRLRPPDRSAVTRPIPDRVKEGLFSRIEARMEIAGSSVLDLFAGTGSVGLEALSRGAAAVTFVERDRSARQRLNENLRDLGEGPTAWILGRSALTNRVLRDLAAIAARRPFDLVFADPPYAMLTTSTDRQRLLKQLSRLTPLCADRSRLIFRMSDREAPGSIAGWAGPASADYGSIVLHWYTRCGGQ